MDRAEAIKKSYLIPGWMWPTELGWLYDTFAASKCHAEIGTFCGRSLFASSGGMTDATIYAVEPLQGYSDCLPSLEWWKSCLESTLSLIPGVEHLQVDSLTASRQLHSRGVVLDSVFIDADHNFAECCADIEAWRPLIRSGGIISGHDYWAQDPGVMEAVNQMFPGGFEVIPQTRIWTAILS